MAHEIVKECHAPRALQPHHLRIVFCSSSAKVFIKYIYEIITYTSENDLIGKTTTV